MQNKKQGPKQKKIKKNRKARDQQKFSKNGIYMV